MAQSLLPYLEEDINGKTYRVNRLKLSKWLELSEIIAKLLGEPFADALYGRASIDIDKLLGVDFGISLAAIAMKGLTKSTLDQLLRLFGMVVQVQGSEGLQAITSQKAEIYWAQNMADFAPSMALFFRVQFADFFEGLQACMPAKDPIRTESNM